MSLKVGDQLIMRNVNPGYDGIWLKAVVWATNGRHVTIESRNNGDRELMRTTWEDTTVNAVYKKIEEDIPL